MKKYTYGKQNINISDCLSMLKTSRSDFLTCGPKISEFENIISEYTESKYCVALSSATAALHIAMLALDITKGDEVITSSITFLASANCVRYVNANIQFSDIEEDTANIDVKEIEKKITKNTKAIIPVHFAGQSCDMEPIYNLAKKHNIYVVEDAAHAIGSEYNGNKVGNCKYSDMTIFSFHPVKTITTAEGGAITTNDEELYKKLLILRSHGMEHKENWLYEINSLGYNYRLTDIQASLGISQMKRLDAFKKRRRDIVDYYNENLGLSHLIEKNYSNACFHLYPILLENRDEFYIKAKEVGLNLQVHYIPVHTQPYYKALGFNYGDYPKAEAYYKKCISIPLYPTLKNSDLKEIVRRIKSIL